MLRFCICFVSKSWNHWIKQKNQGICYSLKKAPVRNAPLRSPEWGWSPEPKLADIQLSRCPDMQVLDIRYQIEVSGKHRSKVNSDEWGELELWPTDTSGNLVWSLVFFLFDKYIYVCALFVVYFGTLSGRSPAKRWTSSRRFTDVAKSWAQNRQRRQRQTRAWARVI